MKTNKYLKCPVLFWCPSMEDSILFTVVYLN